MPLGRFHTAVQINGGDQRLKGIFQRGGALPALGVAVWKPTSHDYPQAALTYLGNVMNTRAASFYREHGVQQVAEAYEKERVEDAVLMFCKHCLRYSMGWCPIHQRVRSPYKEPYYLVSNDGKRFRLEFDCKNCQMKVKAAQ